MDEITAFYKLFGLQPGASMEELKRAYKRLAKQWHPDRFLHEPDRLKLADEKIKAINTAYEFLKRHHGNPVTSSASMGCSTFVKTRKAKPEVFFKRAEKLARSKLYREAAEELSKAVKLNPDYAEAYRFRGRLYTLLGFELRGGSDLNRAAKLGLNFVECDRKIGEILRGETQQPSSKSASPGMERAVKANPLTARPKIPVKIVLDSIFSENISSVQSIAANSRRKTIACGGEDGSIELWNFKTRKCFCRLEGHTARVTHVAFGDDNQILFSSSQDGTVKFWSLSDGSLIKSFKAHQGAVTGFDVCYSHRLLVTSGEDGALRVWNLQDNRRLLRQILGYKVGISALILDALGETAICGAEDGSIHTCSTLSIGNVKAIIGHDVYVEALVLCVDGQRFVSSSSNGEVSLLGMPLGSSQVLFEKPQHPVKALTFCQNGQILCGLDVRGSLIVWDVESATIIDMVNAHSLGPGRLLSISQDMVLSAGKDGVIRQWRIEKRQP
ncbi:hypothetical protein C7271_03255 [filamentous cyanobacterium CCP5]|nr:hypothetical protein C7271_03255 [filamentous cyanobacterium CCP5]